MSEWTMDVYAIGDLWIDARSEIDRALTQSEWERRVPGNCVTIVPAGVCRGRDPRVGLEWLNQRPGVTIVGRGQEETWKLNEIDRYENLVFLPRRGVRRIQCLKADGPGLLVFTTPSWDLRAVDDIDEACARWTELIENTLVQAKEVRGHSKDTLIYVAEHTPVYGFQSTPMAEALDKHDVKLVLFSPDPDESDWSEFYQGRMGKNQYQAPDYRLASADFLSWAPTRVGDIDAFSWTRKERERSPTTKLSWQRSPNADTRPTAPLTIERASKRGEWLYDLGNLEVEPASPLAHPTRSPVALGATIKARYETMLSALQAVSGDYTVADMARYHDALLQRFEPEFDGIPQSTTVGRLRAELARLIRGGGDEWAHELLDLEGGVTIAGLQRKQPEVFDKMREHFIGYPTETPLDQVVEEALRGEAPKRRNLLSAVAKMASNLTSGHGSKPESVSLDEAKRAVLAVSVDNATDFDYELAKAVVRHSNIDRPQSTHTHQVQYGYWPPER